MRDTPLTRTDENTSTPSGWWGVWSIAAGTFLLVTTEFLPIGLLSKIASTFGITAGEAGWSVMVPGAVAAIAAPVLVMLAGKLDRRYVLLALTALIVLANLIAVFAPNYPLFLFGRVLLGIAVGGLWTFAVATGRRLVPESSGGRATSIISAGIGLGTVCGMPVGAMIGDLASWEMAFVANACLGVIVVLAQACWLPSLPSDTGLHPRQILTYSRIPMARVGLIASCFIAGGHFIAYTFLEPYLRDLVALSPAATAWTLAGYAVAGIIGGFIGEHLAGRHIQQAMLMAAAALGVIMVAAALLASHGAMAVGMVMLWGIAFGAIPVCVQIWMYTASPSLYEAGSALMVSIFQIALASGAAIGGLVVDHAGLGVACLSGGVVTLLGALIVLVWRGAPAAKPSLSSLAETC